MGITSSGTTLGATKLRHGCKVQTSSGILPVFAAPPIPLKKTPRESTKLSTNKSRQDEIIVHIFYPENPNSTAALASSIPHPVAPNMQEEQRLIAGHATSRGRYIIVHSA